MNRGTYSRFIKLILYSVDVLILSFLFNFIIATDFHKLITLNSFWLLLAIVFLHEDIYTINNSLIKVIFLLVKRVLVFLLLVFSVFYVTDFEIEIKYIFIFSLSFLVLLIIWRAIMYFFIREYKSKTWEHYTNVVIIGFSESTRKLEKYFKNNKEHDYNYVGFFTNKENEYKLGDFDICFDFIAGKEIDEIYCSVNELSNLQINKLIYFADNNLITLKFIPDDKYVFSKKLQFEYYDLIPVLSLSQVPLKNNFNDLIKRSFDIVFSLGVIIVFLSWFTPIIGLLIKLESKGPVFFKQMRYGADFNLFACYKFRSMKANKDSDRVQASKNDTRVTRIGNFIRKTSIDELPQFYNVLFGSMSIVGPRPLMLSHTNDYKNKINKFMVRHTVKPGITGLAQVSGYRGNIEKDMDMQNRVRYDIFYIENWSLFLDIKIIIQTIKNVFKGEEKAY